MIFFHINNMSSSTFRVRQILPFINYEEAKSLLPSCDKFDVDQVKSFPAWAYKDPLGPSKFGLFIESLLKHATDINEKDWDNTVLNIFVEMFDRNPPFDLNNKVTKNFFKSIHKFAQSLKEYTESFEEGEIIVNNIAGHPDIDSEHILLDIKTTRNFISMKEDSLLQIFSYGALAKENKREVSFVGIVLPMQKKIITESIVGWDHKPFLKLLQTASLSLNPEAVITYFSLAPYKLGSHISKGKCLSSSVEEHKLPVCQVFLSNPQKVEFTKIDESELEKMKKLNIPWYVHSPYHLNIGKKSKDDYQIKLALHELSLANKGGSKGYVLHLGTNKDEKEGEEIAKNTIQQMLEGATKQTPLLLETQAGEGNDLFTSLESLVDLYKHFKGDERLGICVDSAHVWAVGYNPLTFLETITKLLPGSVKLIHFNDSSCHRGSRKDRHALAGKGFVGQYIMSMLFCLADKLSIDMVTE